MERLLPTLGTFLVQLPVFLVWLAAIVLSVIHWRRHPRVSLLTVAGVSGLSLRALLGSYLGMWLPIILQERGWGPARIGGALTVANLLQSIASAAFWILIVAAIFGWRRLGEVQSE